VKNIIAYKSMYYFTAQMARIGPWLTICISFDSGQVDKLCGQLPWLGSKEFENGSKSRVRFNFAIAILLSVFCGLGV
jgi:hypothetical protein